MSVEFIPAALEPLARLTPLYLLTLAALLGSWLLTVVGRARQGERPHFALLAAPGLACLLTAPLAEAPAFFGVGAVLLLIAFYWPYAYRRAHPPRQRAAFPGPALLLSVLASLACTLLPWTRSGYLLSAALLGLALAGLGVALGRVLQPRRRAPRPWQGPFLRLARTQLPVTAELELRFSGAQPYLDNLSATAVEVWGWSPVLRTELGPMNAWLPLRAEDGGRLPTLTNRGSGLLSPWPAEATGLRVWYTHGDGQPRLFRADWHVVPTSERVLN